MFDALQLGLVWFFVALGYVESLKYYTEKPPYIESCRIKEPDFTNCSTHSIQGFLNEVIKGIPEIEESFGPIDPMKQDQLTFTQADSDVASISANLTDLVIRGFGKMIVKESKVNIKDFSWQDKIYLPRMRLDGKYKMVGSVLIIPLHGSGNIFIEIDDLDILLKAKTRLYEKGGYTFYNVTDVSVKVKVGHVRTYLDNLFNGHSKEVEQTTNQFFNDNWRDFFETFRPLIVGTLERTMLDLLRKMFSVMPANFFVEDIPNSLLLYGRKSRLIA
ncbi:circadian clock-controlled protein [Drosophila hydei]|uniref:Circadian clock-controlled protein n=1 Tax=Drosophila hydei TaxID=7224 RepID=A0A6J1MB89_DROHY|nr:circadian clock-controlled protein [Drosophila hydei]